MTILDNCRIITGCFDEKGSIIIDDDKIYDVCLDIEEDSRFRVEKAIKAGAERVDLNGKIVMAGGIDLHVHFREPGLTHKADIETESKAALLGGFTSFIDMPNTNPATTTEEALKDKLLSARGRSWANYGFHIGATNTNTDMIETLVEKEVGDGITRHDFCGIKVFMGSSTGNMLVDRNETLKRLFSIKGKPILVHSEDEQTIKSELNKAKNQFGEDIPMREHSNIRSRMACIKSTIKALEMAIEQKTRLHLLHVSTLEESQMLRAAKLQNIEISGETSSNYLWFCDEDYDRLGSLCKCNPAIKTSADRDYLIAALEDGYIDTIGSDHAPHLLKEKNNKYLKAPSGMPSIQFQIPVLMTLAADEKLSYMTIARAISERPSEIGGIKDRGFIKKGYYADLIVLDPQTKLSIDKDCIASRCGWSPYEGEELSCSVYCTYLNGKLACLKGQTINQAEGKQLYFE